MPVVRRLRPRQLRAVDHDRRGEGTHLAAEADRIGLQQQLARACDDLVFVFVAGRGAGHEDFPVAVAAHAHGVAAAVPEIEIADDADAPRVRCPDHEGDAADAVHLHRMRAELVVERQMIAFAEQIEIEIGEHRRKAIGVLQLDLAVAEARAQPIVLRIVERSREQAGRIDALQFAFAGRC